MSICREFRDPLLGTVELNKLTSDLIGSPVIQRLRFIYKLDLANLIYPTATHSYFGHAVGTMILARATARKLDLAHEDMDCLDAASLLLHSSVCPFQTVVEMIRPSVAKFQLHLLIEKSTSRPDISKILRNHGIKSDKINSIVIGEDENEILNQIFTGPLCASYLDSVVRDSYYLGFSSDTNLADRIIKNASVIERGSHQWIAFSEKAVPDIQRLLITIDQLFNQVYHNKRVLSTRLMLRKMLEHMFIEGSLDLSHLVTMSDEDLLIVLRENLKGKPRMLLKDLFAREYFEPIFSGKTTSDLLTENSSELESKLEGMIGRESGIDVNYIAIKVSPVRIFEEQNIPIISNGNISDARNVSSIIADQEEKESKVQRILCFISPRVLNRVEKLRSVITHLLEAEEK